MLHSTPGSLSLSRGVGGSGIQQTKGLEYINTYVSYRADSGSRMHLRPCTLRPLGSCRGVPSLTCPFCVWYSL